MEHLNAGYLQLGLVALVFGGLKVWWIGSTIRKRDLARPLSEGEFRKALERIWTKKTMSRQDRSRSVTELHMIYFWSSGGPGRARFFIGKTVPTSQERNRCAATEPKVPSRSHNGCLTPPEQATRPARPCRCRHFPGTR